MAIHGYGRTGHLRQPDGTVAKEVRQVIQDFTQVGLDEMVFLPQVPDLDQVGRLAEIVG